MEPNMSGNVGGMLLLVTTGVAVAVLIFASAYGAYQKYKQNRYWDSCQDEEEGSEMRADYYPPGSLVEPTVGGRAASPAEKSDEVRLCCPRSPGNGPEFLEWRPDALPKADRPHAVDNPDKLPMPTGYAMEAKMYEHARAAEDMNNAKFMAEIGDAIEEAKKIDPGLKRLREIIREEISATKLPPAPTPTASGLIDDLASEYEKLPADDLHAHGRAIVKALKAQRRAKADAGRDIEKVSKPKAKAKKKAKRRPRVIHY